MAAAYSTGTATGPTDLLQKLVTFLTGQGWTNDSSVSYGSGWRAHLHKGSQYVHLRAFVNEAANIATGWGSSRASSTAGYGIGLYLGTGYNGANAWNNQAGAPVDTSGSPGPVGAGMYLTSGAIGAYFFFDDGNDHITVVADRGSGLYSHMGWGPSMSKVGFTNDYWYFYGSAPHWYNVAGASNANPGLQLTAGAPMSHSFADTGNFHATCFVRVDAAIYSAQWIGFTDLTTATVVYGYTGRTGRCALNSQLTYAPANIAEYPSVTKAIGRAWQSAFAGALLLPLHCFAQSVAARWIPIGYPPTVFACAGVGHGFTAATVYAVGGLNYMLFPNFAVRKAA